MPGINIVIKRADELSDTPDKAKLPLENMMHGKDYRITKLIQDDRIFAASTGYPTYPIQRIPIPSGMILFEGYSYNTQNDELIANLKSLADVLPKSTKTNLMIKDFILSHDGDYVCIIINNNLKKFWCFNDVLGRLPMYLFQNSEMIILSREIKFILQLANLVEQDKFGIAEILIFGFVLGTSTLVKNVNRVLAGSMITIDLSSMKSTQQIVYQINFEEFQNYQYDSIEKEADKLAEYLLSACKNLYQSFPDKKFMLSLSGGLDSRTVLAGLLAAGASVKTYTFQDKQMASAGNDAFYAEQIAQAFCVDWQLFDRPDLNLDQMKKLSWITDGMNWPKMAFILPIFTQLSALYGTGFIHTTGQFGWLLPQNLPSGIVSSDAFLRFILNRNGYISVKTASLLTSLPATDIIHNIKRKIDGYPEENYANKISHFAFYENMINLNFQAENRNRVYFWHTCPYNSLKYILHALKMPNEYKNNKRLYRMMIENINPLCTQVGYASFDRTESFVSFIDAYKIKIWDYFSSIYDRSPELFRKIIKYRKRFKAGYYPDSTELGLTKKLFSQYDQNVFCIDRDLVRGIVAKGSKKQYHNLINVLLYDAVKEDYKANSR
ncbi:asparagine synthase-related protein [Calditrichota bacterium]